MILGGLAIAALTAIVMLIIAITGSVEAADALTLLVLGGVILLIVGIALIVLAVWPDLEPEPDFGPRAGDVHAWDWLGTMVGGAFRPSQDTYDGGAGWSIPGWEPPDSMPELKRPPPERRPLPERRPPVFPAGQISKYDGGGAGWSIPGWEPPETTEEPARPPPERRAPERRARERQPRPQLSKFD